jgi:hypothetical protein
VGSSISSGSGAEVGYPEVAPLETLNHDSDWLVVSGSMDNPRRRFDVGARISG